MLRACNHRDARNGLTGSSTAIDLGIGFGSLIGAAFAEVRRRA